ncbi:MAG: glycogen-binding domain-containing protein [Prolixibacteraceae bacterium]|jgi:hypothetical protein|nr:glycogen-binding domain-containing protein [Prolixibacteraceae bacterium]
MRKYLSILLLFIFILSSLHTKAQYDPDKVCRIENGKIIFLLNLKWSEKEKKEISALFDLDSTLMARAFKGEANIYFEGDQWKAVRLKSYTVELSKPFDLNSGKKEVNTEDLYTLIDKWISFEGKDDPGKEVFGVNKFEISYTFHYDKTAWFYLAGRKSAKNVYISGSFNGWSTTQNPMKQVDTGWTVDLDLKPGKYTYKFIIDGTWISDPYNKLREDDGAGGYNSVVFCNNHLFKLKGNETSRSVHVVGNFNNWNPRELAMTKTPDGWVLPIYLRDGSYTYKFIVDGKWDTDPANPSERKDGHGTTNSVLDIGEPYLFTLAGYTDARRVVLAGSFNNWKTDELLMDKTANGWKMPYILPAGNYEYKFIVDGKWITDPGNPFSKGEGNYENSFLALKANYLFLLNNHADAGSVIVNGSFNGWNKKGYSMVKKDGKWIFPLYLKPGKYTYKYIVDKTWIIDPGNKLYEQNEYGTYNSVLWISQ